MKHRTTFFAACLAISAFFFLKNTTAAQPYRWYVNGNSTATPFGFDWQTPFNDLQQALDFANAGDEVWVAAGTYKPTDDGNRDKSFNLKSGVKFYGGFAGTENSPAERIISANPTILSGDIGQPGDSTDNSRTIMYLDHPDSTTLISGFVFEGGAGDE